MNYNYPQPQYQPQQVQGYTGYRTQPQFSQWAQAANTASQIRPVSSIEEVRACPIDFDGSVFYFADVANKRIYTKQINLDGTVSINLYEQKECPTPQTDQPINSSYVTKQEFESVIKEIKQKWEQLINVSSKEEKVEDVEQVAAQPTKSPLFSF